MYKNLTWFMASDSPAAHRSLARVIIKTLPVLTSIATIISKRKSQAQVTIVSATFQIARAVRINIAIPFANVAWT